MSAVLNFSGRGTSWHNLGGKIVLLKESVSFRSLLVLLLVDPRNVGSVLFKIFTMQCISDCTCSRNNSAGKTRRRFVIAVMDA